MIRFIRIFIFIMKPLFFNLNFNKTCLKQKQNKYNIISIFDIFIYSDFEDRLKQ